MAAHAKSGGKLAAVVNWAAAALAAIMVFGIGCVAGYQAQDSYGQPTFWIVFGGNTDNGDGNGHGQASQQLIDGGWVDPANIFQVTWNADVSNTDANTDAAMGPGKVAYYSMCKAHNCVLAGFSLGNDPAIQLANQVNHPAQNLYLFGAPQPSTGIWHHFAPDNPMVAFWIDTFGQSPNRVAPAGSNAFYDTHDPYANAAPQCTGPGLWALNVNPGHRIIARGEATHDWVGSDGVNMHEAAYVAPPGLPASGSDPPALWAGCPPAGFFGG